MLCKEKMKNRFLMLTLLLLLVNLTSAESIENYDNFKALEIGVNINSSVLIEKTVSNPQLDHLTTILFFYPRESFTSDIEYNNPYSYPNATIEQAEDISYTWKTLDYDKLIFGIESKVKTYNDFVKVRNKINFPLEELSNEIKEYTKPTENIDVNDKIKNKAQEIISGETDEYVAAFKIAEWVKKNIKYDLNTLTAEVVQKSSWVYDNKEGVCDEMTSLFISMLRSVGIPARFISGIVYTNVLYDFGSHGWAEVFFPGYGWLPFDVTFGQYGYVDPSHVKFDASKDSKNNAIVSTSLAHGIEVNLSKYNYGAKVIKSTGEVEPQAKLEIAPVEETVGFGSFVPLEVKLENLQDYYLPLNIFLSKAPEVYNNETQIQVLLKPFEKKSAFFIVKVKSDLDKSYIYTSELEVKTSFNGIARSKLTYNKNAEVYSLEKAKALINNYTEKESKLFFSDINIKCESNKRDYYRDEKAYIKCLLENKGNTNLKDIKVCIKEDCHMHTLGISENIESSFVLDLNKVHGKKELRITAENDKMVKYSDAVINVFLIPNINLETDAVSVGYYENKTIKFNLISNTKLKNVILDFNTNKINYKNIENATLINLNLLGKEIKKNKLKVKLSYNDELNKTYEKSFSFNLEVKNIPWYIKIYNFFV